MIHMPKTILMAVAATLMSTAAQATPAAGEYSNMNEGSVVKVNDLPDCSPAQARDRVKALFKRTHLRLSPDALVIAGIDSGEPGVPAKEVVRDDTSVVGWRDLNEILSRNTRLS